MEDDTMGDVQAGTVLPESIDLARQPSRLGEFAFEEVATSVEERFRRAYDADRVGTAKVESQMEYTLVSLGWWLVIKRLGLALWIGKDKPAIESGDLLRITICKRDLPVQ
jgi:hypothetical protein